VARAGGASRILTGLCVPRSVTALAVGEVEATVAPSSALIRAPSDAATAVDLVRVLASQLRDADRKHLEFAALDTLGRVAWRLKELSERFGGQTAEGIEVELPLCQEQARQRVRRVARGHGKGALDGGKRWARPHRLRPVLAFVTCDREIARLSRRAGHRRIAHGEQDVGVERLH
jgi:CRP-like cAMP-binding protein